MARAHALLFPCPLQGHINPFMQLGYVLAQNNIMVTFVNTESNHALLNNNVQSVNNIRFLGISDGHPKEVAGHNIPALAASLITNGSPFIEKIVLDTRSSPSDEFPPISIIISDGVMPFTQDIADKLGIPRIAFWTFSACGVLGLSSVPILKEHGFIPAPEDAAEMEKWRNKFVGCIPTLETLRGEDLPRFFRATDVSDYMINSPDNQSHQTHRADLVILNTWEDLEGPVVAELNKKYNGKVLSMGPLTIFAENMPMQTSLWEEESSCLSWLDQQSAKSVVYVGFGSIALLKEEQVAEFAYGLENCGQPFLWVVRPDLIRGNSSSSFVWEDFVERCKDRACFVSWTPQIKVLNHPSIACFLTHSGWNSTVESICAGVPMLCWPYFCEQQTNRRFSTTVWKVGLELSEGEKIRREEIVQGVKKIMHDYEEVAGDNEFHGEDNIVKNVRKYQESALSSSSEGGCSHANMTALVERIIVSSPTNPA